MKFTKGNLVADVGERLNLQNDEARRVVDAVLKSIAELTGKAPLTIACFGRFERKQFKARLVRHPMTGAMLNIPAIKKLTFSASKPTKGST